MKKLLILSMCVAGVMAASNALANATLVINGSQTETCEFSTGAGDYTTGTNTVNGADLSSTSAQAAGSFYIYCNNPAGFNVSASSASNAAFKADAAAAAAEDDYDVSKGYLISSNHGADYDADATRIRHRAPYTLAVGGTNLTDMAGGHNVLSTNAITAEGNGDAYAVTFTFPADQSIRLAEDTYSDTVTFSIAAK